MHRPPTLATVAEATPATNGCPSCTVTQARRASRDGSSSLSLNPASDAVYLGPSRERTANGRRSSAGQHRVHSCDRRKGLAGPRRLGPGVQGSHSVSRHCPRDSSRAEYARRKVESSFWSGAGSQPSCGRRGQAVVRRTVPLRSLDDWLVPACYQ